MSATPRALPAPSVLLAERNRALRLLVCAMLAAILYLPALGRPALWEPDEGRYAEIAREMVLAHDYVTPRDNWVRYFEKPPLVYWVEALWIKLLGVNELAVRLPAARVLAVLRGRELRLLWPHGEILSPLVLRGFPMSLQMFIMSAAGMTMLRFVNHYGDLTSAAYVGALGSRKRIPEQESPVLDVQVRAMILVGVIEELRGDADLRRAERALRNEDPGESGAFRAEIQQRLGEHVAGVHRYRSIDACGR